MRAYAVRNQNLTVCDYVLNDCGAAANNGDPAIWVPIANNVVSLRAQYGRDTTDAPPPPLVLARMDGTVDVWDQARLWDQAPWVAGSVSADAAKDTAACALLRGFGGTGGPGGAQQPAGKDCRLAGANPACDAGRAAVVRQ